jgi:hypothetical protein
MLLQAFSLKSADVRTHRRHSQALRYTTEEVELAVKNRDGIEYDCQ